ncbi:protease modulator HflC [Sphingomonas donggukensis]|uniref:Protein HflC n=1 Tax=Sphingomonas donggukensis TaxID=2949093 RepID=A0ABY4TXU8_9SPHN|nr:protease modulator HflC [Sphingomonas donggukensis]URW75366.1 protease modulator HflC [Sphingomonas donggukensis]
MIAWRNPMTAGILALAGLIVLASTFTIVPETRQAVILRFEQPVGRPINGWAPGQQFGNTGAGLIAKIPFVDKIVWVDKRVLDVDLDNQQVLSTDQLRLQVDAFARFRIVDPLKMVITARTEDGVIAALQPLFSSSLRAELGKRDFAVLLSPERGEVMDNIQNRLQRLASQYGVQIVDVRIKHADLPDGTPLESALNRMRTARQQQALTIRAQGQKAAQIVRADADANASRIYADAFGKDPSFYDFYRSMQSYRYTFGADGGADAGRGGTSIILSPQNGYLRNFQGR